MRRDKSALFIRSLSHNTFLLPIKNQRKKDDPPAPNILCLLPSIILTVSEFKKKYFYLSVVRSTLLSMDWGRVYPQQHPYKPTLATAMKCVNCTKLYKVKRRLKANNVLAYSCVQWHCTLHTFVWTSFFVNNYMKFIN